MEFFLNNLSFAIDVALAILFFTLSWLSYDSYKIQKDNVLLSKTTGFLAVGVAFVGFISFPSTDIYNFFFHSLLILGLILVLSSFYFVKKLEVASIIVIPSFSLWSGSFYAIEGILALLIAILSFRKAKTELNTIDERLSLGFLLFSLSVFVKAFNQFSSPYLEMTSLALLVAASAIFIRWLWHYMQLRFEESFVVLLISSALLLSAIITLAFSTLLVERVSVETDDSLSKDTKIALLEIDSLREQAKAKAALIALNQDVIVAIIDSKDQDKEFQVANSLMLSNYLGFLIIADENGNVIARGHDSRKFGDSVYNERGFEEALDSKFYSTIADSNGEGLSVRAYAPIFSGKKLVGVVVAGFQLDNPFLDKIKRVTGLDLFIYKNNISVASTAFTKDGTGRLSGNELKESTINNDVLSYGRVVSDNVIINGINFRSVFAPLTDADEKIVGMISSAKMESDILKIINDTNRLTLVTVMIVLIFLSIPIYLLSKKIVKTIT